MCVCRADLKQWEDSPEHTLARQSTLQVDYVLGTHNTLSFSPWYMSKSFLNLDILMNYFESQAQT